ncbi:hypothetical protein N9I51_00775 [Gammaproteobacteria bacterium]|nr:hypothetical protein [Gammaproteobacteria bacterium]MDA8935574.1 hypothetical protein [Gammaproteobacteria bacterium]
METLNEILTVIAAVVTVYILGATVVALAEFITWYSNKEKNLVTDRLWLQNISNKHLMIVILGFLTLCLILFIEGLYNQTL